MTLLEKMDRLVYATRIDRLIFRKIEPRTLRWSPILVLIALIVGYVLMARAPDVLVRSFCMGLLLFYGAVLAAHLVRSLGPRLTPTVRCPLDEREMMVRAQAHAVSGRVFAISAMLGCFYMATSGLPGFWHPQTPYDWVNLGFGLQAAEILLPSLVASWLQPNMAED